MRFDHLSNPVCQTNCFQSLSAPFQDLNRTAPVNQALRTGLNTAFPSVTSIVYEPKVGFAWSKSGNVVIAAEAALEYGFADSNGKQPASLREQKGSPRSFFKKG
jgi:hypothetical protein